MNQKPKRNNPHIVCVLWELDGFLRNSAILKSQAIGQMRYLSSLGACITIVCSDPKPEEFMKSYGAELIANDFKVLVIPTRGLKNLLSLRDFKKTLAKLNNQSPIDYLYIRNFWNVFAIPDKKVKVVFDLRGANLEETTFNFKGCGDIKLKFKNAIYSYIEKKAIKRANYLQCVSGPLKQYIYDRFGRGDAQVVNSCFESIRFEKCKQYREKMRSKLGIGKEEKVFMFLGGLAAYQEIDFMFSLWGRLAEAIKESRFLFFTSHKNHKKVKQKLLTAGVPKERFWIESANYDEVPEVCAAGDFGFLLRQDIVLNHVASPVKFAEYLAAGLGVITSPRIGDISDCVVKNKIGCLVEIGDDVSSIEHIKSLLNDYEKDRAGLSRRAQNVALEKFSWESYKDYYLSRYFQY